MFISWRMDKLITAYPYNEMLLNNNETGTCREKEPNSECLLYDSIYIKYKKRQI